MVRRPPPRPVYHRSRFSAAPRRLWLVAAIVIGIAALLVIRHMRERQDTPVALSNRSFLLRQTQAALRADPNVVDLVYSAPRDQWDVTPATPDTDPRAFGRYLCFTLAQAGVTQPQTSVRVIDGARLEANGFDYAAASRGTVSCREEAP